MAVSELNVHLIIKIPLKFPLKQLPHADFSARFCLANKKEKRQGLLCIIKTVF